MAINNEDRSVIRDIIADFLGKKEFQTEKMCTVKMDNMEVNVKSVNSKLWVLIFLHISVLGTVAYIGFR